jgi:hypothetical protein
MFLAQTDDSGAAALGVLIALGVIGLQIYLIVAIIGTRHDVKWIRWAMSAGGSPTRASVPGSLPLYSTPLPPQSVSPPQVAYSVTLREGGNAPQSVVRILMERCGYMRSGALGAVQHPPQMILSTRSRDEAQALAEAIEQVGGSVEITQSGAAPVQSQPEATAEGALSAAQMVGARSASTKQCPDCAESVLAEARVCRYCGYRFDV